MMQALGRQLDVAVAVRPLGFADLFDALEDGRIDAVASSITVTPERRARFDFSQPYYATSQAAVTLRTSGVKDIQHLSGMEVATMRRSTNSDWLEANKTVFAIRSIRYVDGMDQALALLRAGEIAAYFGDEPALLYELLSSRDLAVIARLPTHDRYAIMLRKDSPWTARLDAALAAIKTNGELEAIHRKWFGIRPPEDSPVRMVLRRP